MKKLFTLLIILLLWAGSSWATTVQVGSGSGTSVYLPIRAYYGYSYSQQIYTQAQIATVGTITKIRFYLSSGTPTNSSAWVVYLGHTTKTSFTSTSDWVPVASMTQVFSGTVTFPAASNWMEITLTTSFDYDNINNLVVAVDENTPGYAASDVYWGAFTSGTNTGIYYYNDNTNPDPASPPTGTRTSSIDQIQFEIVANGGPANPTAFTATAVSSTQINLSWALNGAGNAVMLVWNSTNTFGTPANGTPYGVGATIPGGGTVLQNNTNLSYNHTSLTPNTPYYYKAFSVDGTITYSSGVTASATTLCVIASQINEDFELTAFPPACWSLVSGSGNWARTTLASGYGSGSASALANFYNISGSTPFDLVSPQFNATGAIVSFDHAYATFETEVDQLKIYYSTNGGSSYTLLITLDGGISGPLNTGGAMTGEFVPSASQWATKSYSLPAGTNKVKFQAISAYGNDLYLDNIFIGQPPSVDLRFNQFYQNSGLPIPLNAGSGSNYLVKNKMASGIRMDFFTTLQSDATGIPASEVINTILVPDQNRSITSIMLADIQVTAEIENIGLDPASYVLDWAVGGIAQTSYTGPTVNPGNTDVANLLYPSPPARGTFFATGAITVVNDANPGNNNNEFRLRVYPDVYSRTIYDRGDNTVDTYIGWNSATIAMKAGVRYTASDYIKPVGVDFICRTETVPSGTYTIEVRAAGATDQAPGAVLYSIPYTDPVFFSEGGDYMHFAFDESLMPTIAPGSDYWITIECPMGVLYPGGAHNSGFTLGRSFYYVASTDSWTPLIITTERAWIMRSVQVQGVLPECPVPTLQTVTNKTPSGADLGWTDAAGTYWDLYIVPAGDPAPTLLSVPTIDDNTNNPYTWSGGNPSTPYDWYVRRECDHLNSNVNVSTWTTVSTFTTLCSGVANYPYCESFDGQTFPPDCWITQKTAGTGTPGTWDGQTAGTYPTCSPHSGVGMARYNSFSLSAGTAGILASLPLDLPNDNYLTNFWMYRDDGYIGYSNELVNVYFNTQNNLTGATLLGTIHRSIDYSPVVASNGWYEYSLNFPVGSGGTGRYVIFEAVSQFGNNIFVDDVCITLSCTWTGNISTAWNDPGNWTCGVVPNQSVSVFIPSSPAGGRFPVIANGVSAECFDITVESPGTLSIQTGGTLNVLNP